MKQKKYPETLRFVNMLPQLSTLLLWTAQVVISIGSPFILSAMWPIPYKDAFKENFTLYYIFYSLAILLICTLAFIKPRLAAIPLPVIVLFEIYTFISPIIFKAVYYSGDLAFRYTASIFDVTSSMFYSHTLKSLILIAIGVMMFIAISSKSKKKTLTLFTFAAAVAIAFSIYETVNILTATATQPALTSPSIIVGILRMITLFPFFFIGLHAKDN